MFCDGRSASSVLLPQAALGPWYLRPTGSSSELVAAEASRCYGSPVFIHEAAIVEPGASIGQGSSVWHHAHVRSGALIGDDCTLGKNVFVDAGVRIGHRVKIQNNVSVYAGVKIEDEVFVGPNTVFTNDRRPRAHAFDWQVAPTLVQRGASLGANSTILCGLQISEWAMVAAGSVVTHDVLAHQLVAGNPARHLGWCCWCGRVVSRADVRPRDAVCECGLPLGVSR
jgi:UDP-2-acetamido-3-amino-2,3-dideoxy-glucuronate N-acetyltransferase